MTCWPARLQARRAETEHKSGKHFWPCKIPWHPMALSWCGTPCPARASVNSKRLCKVLSLHPRLPIPSYSPYSCLQNFRSKSLSNFWSPASQLRHLWPDGRQASTGIQDFDLDQPCGHISKEPNRSFASPSWIPTTRLLWSTLTSLTVHTHRLKWLKISVGNRGTRFALE